MNYNDFLDLVKGRRSIRRFKSDPIPDEYVNKIIEAARWAPSGANTQPWEFIIIRDQVLKVSIIKIINALRGSDKNSMGNQITGEPDPPAVTKAPVFILVLGDMRARIGLPGKAGQDDRKWQSVLTSSLASAFLYLHLAARSLGLSSQWQSGVERPDAGPALRKLLGIPDYMQIYDMIVIGYPDMAPGEKRMRHIKEMVHYDFCGHNEFRNAEEIQAFCRRDR